MKQIRWGFIGCGEVTEKKSGPAFREVEGSDVVAVMGRNPRKTRLYAERHHIPKWYTDASELIDDPDVNAIYIATPPSSHATFAIMAMKAGKPVYVEKPLASSYDDCVRVNRVSEQTGIPCFVAYYRRYLPYFVKVKNLVNSGAIGKIMNVQLRFSCPPREIDHSIPSELPWRLQPDISGGGYFYDLAPHQFDLLQYMFGIIIKTEGICINRGGFYKAEDTISACFQFESGVPGSGSWCFVGHESSRDDRIEVIGDAGMLSFSVFSYAPIELITSEGQTSITVPNPPYVQLPIIKSVIEHLQGSNVCVCTSVSATPVNWVMDRILGKF
ncbi:Gfo/Idh/MocA family protein [Prevotella sp. OH937_COT-195]|uniref:Gfo/Idh/MocA family protein n=1 Tax=Prevotella sp. OH937_COT-195 TaxID=2491051 RepID=UPI000F649C67|nr:Gfo/Idh/MocA family oxidoreductase [Prevotella sp. OH937_COT-195]RRD02996.1 gfo/Idh/MocA family oxidoreductase [Prevotella sp. OH937_COT-195]